ncbi:hypothetical protein GEMRC1_011740 [Eukaryota sp. GEM-RC1]
MRAALKQQIDSSCTNLSYSPESAEKLASQLSSDIHTKIRTLAPPRYKFVVNVITGEMGDQTMRVCAQWLWDAKTDNCATYSFKNASMYVTASVYFLYQE